MRRVSLAYITKPWTLSHLLALLPLWVSLCLPFWAQGLLTTLDAIRAKSFLPKLRKTLVVACRDTCPFPLPVTRDSESKLLSPVQFGSPLPIPVAREKGQLIKGEKKCWADKKQQVPTTFFCPLCEKVELWAKIRTHQSNGCTVFSKVTWGESGAWLRASPREQRPLGEAHPTVRDQLKRFVEE